MEQFDYDLIVVGGGSGGLAASKKAVDCGAKKVVVFDYVKPTSHGTRWGLGGTCVNVGCIPKKLFHYAATMNSTIHHDAKAFGWKLDSDAKLDWNVMIQNIQNYVKKLNFSYRTGLKSKGVEYINALAKIDDPNTVSYTQKGGEIIKLRTKHILIAVGGRPYVPSEAEVPGAKEYSLTSDDLFSWPHPPGKTLVVGASYIGLECAGFLTELGYQTTVAVRSILLRGFDRQCAEKVGQLMKEVGTSFVYALPSKIEKLKSGKLLVQFNKTEVPAEQFDTVLYAVGRRPDTQNLNLNALGVSMDSIGKIFCTNEQSSVPSIYVVGDALHGTPELTPVAIRTGELLVRRLFEQSTEYMNWSLIATTVFTPFEYGTCGYSEEVAIEKFGTDQLDIFLYEFPTLEIAASHRHKVEATRETEFDVDLSPNCFVKLICLKSENMRVVGFHYIGLHAGEITQGYAVALRLGATKADFDATIGIHPTDAEALHNLSVTKASGNTWVATGGCGGGKCG